MKNKMFFIICMIFFIIILGYTDSLAADDIPKVYFEGDMTNMTTKKDERTILLKYRSQQINFDKYTKIKLQGSSSLAYEKKNYTIKFYSDNSYNYKEKVDVGFGWGAQSKYCLKANWIDRTHSRNIVSARIASSIQAKYGVLVNTPHNGTIDGFPVEVYLNGDFLGLYTWNIPKDAWMWNMDEDNPNHIVLGGGGYTNSTVLAEEITSFEESKWDVEVGLANQDTIDKFNRLIRFINTNSNEKFIQDFELYLNKDASLNYLVMLYLIEGIDNYANNLMMATYDGEIWYPCLYDLDITFGTCSAEKLSYEIVPLSGNLWLRMMDCFPNEIANRWFELRKDIFTKESIMKEFHTFINSIPVEVYQKESQKWGNPPGYGIEQIEDYLDFRIPYIDNIMYAKYNISPEVSIEYSTNEKTNKDVLATLKTNRNDIVILIDGKVTYDYTYTFSENGLHIFEYQDWNGNNRHSITANVDWIDKDAPILEVKYEPETETNGEVAVILYSNEPLQELDEWELSDDKLQLRKIYTENIIETVEVKDLLGNVTTVDINVSNISTIPFITSVSYSEQEKTNKDILVSITSNKELQPIEGYTLSEDTLTLSKRFEENVNIDLEIITKNGQSKTINISITNIDKEKPILNIEYSIKDETSESVMVTVYSNEELKDIEGWTLSEDKLQIKKEYNKNTTEKVLFEDLVGNVEEIIIDIQNIVTIPFSIQINKSTTEQTSKNVIVTINSNKQLKKVDGWILSEDKYKLMKEYSSNTNGDEIITIYSIDNEKIQAVINVSNIEEISDTTIANTPIPNTGVKQKIILTISILSILSIIFVILYKKYI